jgi:hypothetical protein
LNAWTNLYELRYVYHGTWAHLNGVLHKYLPSVCVLYVYVARQRLGKKVIAATNTQAIEALLDASFSMRSMSYERRVYESVCVWPIVATKRLSKHVPAATKNSLRRRFLYGPCRIKGK